MKNVNLKLNAWTAFFIRENLTSNKNMNLNVQCHIWITVIQITKSVFKIV